LSDVWKTFGIFLARRAIQMISYRDCWPLSKPGYITMTWRQRKIQWSGGIASHHATFQKIPSLKIRCKSNHCCRGDLVGRKNFEFFEWLPIVRGTDYKVYRVSWGVWWINTELGRWILFLSFFGLKTLLYPRKWLFSKCGDTYIVFL
jgi:hypothetical protein